jgi:hypothetical protein
MVAVCVVLFGFAAVPEVSTGQSISWERRTLHEQPHKASSPAGTRVPSWARPGGQRRERGPHPEVRNFDRRVTSNFHPPEPVPLGGLEWLLAAGLGYGAYRLRGQRDDDAAA